MNLEGKHTPLNLNCLGELLQNRGLQINFDILSYIGTSTSVSDFTGSGTFNTTCGGLSSITSLAYSKLNAGITPEVYNNILNIGSTTIPAIGGAKPSTYNRPYTGELTSYGWLRLLALQAHNEFYPKGTLSYSDFLNTFSSSNAFKQRQNKAIQAFVDSQTYLDGAYSNMNDLITGDITGVSLSTFYWGQDLIATGKAIDLKSIDTFGNPENLLRTMHKYRAISKSVSLALLSAGLDSSVIEFIVNGGTPTVEQQNSLYASFLIIMGKDLADVCIPLNCQTTGLDSLADLLDPKKLFPNSYQTLTFPTYNTAPGPTNSKTFHGSIIGPYGMNKFIVFLNFL